jgi:hypothetical protein
MGAVVAEGDGRGSLVSLPAGAIIKIKSGPTDGDGMVDVLWGGRTIAMFTIALHLHTIEIMSKMATVRYRLLSNAHDHVKESQMRSLRLVGSANPSGFVHETGPPWQPPAP